MLQRLPGDPYWYFFLYVRYRESLLIALLVVAALALYAPSLGGGFIIDDYAAVRFHPGVQGPWSTRALVASEYWGQPFGHGNGLWRPVTTITFFVDHHLGGGAPWVFHATNLVLFAGVLLVANRFLRRWGTDALSPAARLLALAAFAAMAIHVDVVPSLVGRTDLLAMLLSLVALDLAASSALGPLALGGLVLSLTGAALSKETAVPTGVLAAYLLFRRCSAVAPSLLTPWQLPVARALCGAIAALATTATIVAFRASHGLLTPSRPIDALDNPIIGQPALRRLVRAAEILARYFEHALVPADMCPDYGYAAFTADRVRSIFGAVLVAVALVALVVSFRRRRHLADAIVAFGASYVAVSHLLVAGSTIFADRLFFFPSFWFVVVVALMFDELARRQPRSRPVLLGAVTVFTLGQAVLLFLGVPTRRNQHNLAVYGVAACPQVARIRLYRADAAHEDREPLEAAWALLMASTLRRHFPAPIPEGKYPSWWEAREVGERVELLRQSEGSAALVAALREAQVEANTKGATAASRILGTWIGVLTKS